MNIEQASLKYSHKWTCVLFWTCVWGGFFLLGFWFYSETRNCIPMYGSVICCLVTAIWNFPRRNALLFDSEGFKHQHGNTITDREDWKNIKYVEYFSVKHPKLRIRASDTLYSFELDWYLPVEYTFYRKYSKRLDRELEAICRTHQVRYVLNCPSLNEEKARISEKKEKEVTIKNTDEK